MAWTPSPDLLLISSLAIAAVVMLAFTEELPLHERLARGAITAIYEEVVFRLLPMISLMFLTGRRWWIMALITMILSFTASHANQTLLLTFDKAMFAYAAVYILWMGRSLRLCILLHLSSSFLWILGEVVINSNHSLYVMMDLLLIIILVGISVLLTKWLANSKSERKLGAVVL